MKSRLDCKVFAWLGNVLVGWFCVLIFLIQKWNLFLGNIKKKRCLVLLTLISLFKAWFLSLALFAKLPPYLPLSATEPPLQLPNSWAGFITAFSWFPLLPVVRAGSQPRLQPNDSKCKISSRSVSRYYPELTITYFGGVVPFGRAPLLFRGPLNFWKFTCGEVSATFQTKFFFIGNYPLLKLLLCWLIFIFSSALGFSISESQVVMSF